MPEPMSKAMAARVPVPEALEDLPQHIQLWRWFLVLGIECHIVETTFQGKS